MASFILNGIGQVELAANFTLAELKTIPDAIREGRQAIPRHEPEPEPVAPVEPASPTQVVFLMRSVKFRDCADKTVFGLQYRDCEMPVKSAQYALRCKVKMPVTDPATSRSEGLPWRCASRP